MLLKKRPRTKEVYLLNIETSFLHVCWIMTWVQKNLFFIFFISSDVKFDSLGIILKKLKKWKTKKFKDLFLFQMSLHYNNLHLLPFLSSYNFSGSANIFLFLTYSFISFYCNSKALWSYCWVNYFIS
jgi:hypothetical protein